METRRFKTLSLTLLRQEVTENDIAEVVAKWTGVPVAKIMEGELIGLGLLDKNEVKNQNPEMPLYKQYFMHGTSHFLGLDVHDVGNRYEPMKPGMIFTCEPGIYIPQENLGIRIENDILITTKDPIDLMAAIPVEVEKIEEAMREAAQMRAAH